MCEVVLLLTEEVYDLDYKAAMGFKFPIEGSLQQSRPGSTRFSLYRLFLFSYSLLQMDYFLIYSSFCDSTMPIIEDSVVIFCFSHIQYF